VIAVEDHATWVAAPPVAGSEPALPRPGDRGEPGTENPVEAICRLHGPPLYRFLLRITFGDRREAEDLLQETLLRAWRYLQDHTADVTKLRPWLYTIARRAAIDAARARQARPTEVILTDLTTLPAGRDDIEQLLDKLTVQRALMSLTPDHRQVLIEVYYHGRTAHEAAEALGIPEGTVKSRIYYGLRALAAVIGEKRPGTRQNPQTPGRRRPRKGSLRRPPAARPR
jgi:RNA polymerase sigma-70 factor (ECF subfamily)